MHEEFPEGFKWDCCNKTGESEGCAQDCHEAANKKKRKNQRLTSDRDLDKNKEDEETKKSLDEPDDNNSRLEVFY